MITAVSADIGCKLSGRIVGEVIRWTVVLARKTSSRYRVLNGNACILGKVVFRVCFHTKKLTLWIRRGIVVKRWTAAAKRFCIVVELYIRCMRRSRRLATSDGGPSDVEF